MTAALYAVAVLLFCTLVLASVLVQMYSEALSLRKRRDKGASLYFANEVQPRIGCNPEEGKARYTIAQFVCLILLTTVVLFLSAQQATLGIAVIEAMALCLVALVAGALVLPTILALRTGGRWLGRLAWVCRILGWATLPIVFLGDFAASIASVSNDHDAPEQGQKPSEEIDALLDVGQKEGLFDADDRKLIHSVVGFGDKTVREVMTPRPRVVAISAEADLSEVRQINSEKGYSRIPVYAGSIDNVVGFIHTRDTLEYTKDELAETKVGAVSRSIALIPETKRIPELMREMQEARTQIAMVIDEYGHTAGLVTMEDMMEEIVGEIEDETDPPHDVEEQADKSFITHGGIDLDLLEELVGYRPEDKFESTTVGGLVCEKLGQVPTAGAKVRLNGLEVEVLASDGRSVQRVHLRRRSPASAEQGQAP